MLFIPLPFVVALLLLLLLARVISEGGKAALLVDEDDYDGELRGLIRHARELHEILLCEQKRSKVSWVVDELRAVCDEMGASLNQFESLLTELRPSISE